MSCEHRQLGQKMCRPCAHRRLAEVARIRRDPTVRARIARLMGEQYSGGRPKVLPDMTPSQARLYAKIRRVLGREAAVVEALR